MFMFAALECIIDKKLSYFQQIHVLPQQIFVSFIDIN